MARVVDGRGAAFFAAGAACGCVVGAALARRLGARDGRGGGTAGKECAVLGKDFRGKKSAYSRITGDGVVGLLAYNVCEPLTEAEYDRWLFDVHYHDLMANPFLQKIVLRTVNRDRKAKLSSGAAVTNEIEFYRLAELHFRDFEAYDSYIQWFQANVIPPVRTPAGKSAFKFYLLSQDEAIIRMA
eukprot:TRINITY_DN34919_c0_g1_i1.p1 TRINITY_DN34919_c0_g1~~TRINITY_DN34919_c0_g1_i1.p1  ORF type:complete len:185 (+),score=27.87 TRINITY_DN34919_c0_g1_i1:96-650(+)